MNGLLSTLSESPEFSLLLKLTHPSPEMDRSEIISEITAPQFDCKKFQNFIEWHRVTPQAYQQLQQVKDDLPDGFFGELKSLNTRCRMTSLSMSSWLARVSLQLRTHNIDFILLKGTGLSHLLYGEDSYREVRDIDILVAPEDIDATECILFELGFVRTMPSAGATPKQIHFFNRHKKDREYYHPDSDAILELHTSLIEPDHPFHPTLPDLLAAGTSVTVHGERVGTMAGNLLWLYQCLHGSLSGWYRMRWICDIALLLKLHQPNWGELLRLAGQYHCRNSLIEAVGLACALYGLPVPDPVQAILKHSRRVQRNIEGSANRLFHMQTCMPIMAHAQRISFSFPTQSLVKYLLFRCFISISDFELVRLPDRFFFAYYLLRPFLFLFRHICPEKWCRHK
ncbi:MAG TPA: nucleotidyltransferase family protein [Anaerolineales bacterium]|nr:nucleotidyltransferase family protein [Anaerolineales bacterium]